ncbi:glycoside hydrolase family 88 protein [Microbacterium sp. AK009]|uniref:glycoside hydrolase family 88 protein n=1 Tax=Microbacterium sp. AK009 TaxID=2723068 RepID=UPI001C5493CA|nr:glycoside hydrolase family 88 protein [Microbacterium sp. AK009]
MSGVAWGVDDYVAEADAAAALRDTRRAGPARQHSDTPLLAEQVADALLDLQFKTWDFGDSVAFEALIAASERLGLDRWERFAHGWGRAWATRSRPFARLDCTVPGRALTLLSERHRDWQLMNTLIPLAEFLRQRRTLHGVYETWDASPILAPYGNPPVTARDRSLVEAPPPGVFVDCLHFDPPFFAALGRVAQDDELTADGVMQALGYIRLLQRDDGLFDHFVLRGEEGSFGPGWGRGQGWAALGLLEVVIELRARREAGGDGRFDGDELQLADAAARLLERMAQLQRLDGHWEVIVDRADSGDEFSTAAFMAHAMREAIALGVGDRTVLAGSAVAARSAVLASLDGNGQLREVSAAVYASTVPEHYAAVPRGYVVPWGQGPALLALVADAEEAGT